MCSQKSALTSQETSLSFSSPEPFALKIYVRFILVLIALCIAFPAFATKGPVCVKGPSEPKSPIIPKIRPIQMVQCSYGFDDFVARLTALAIDTQSLDSVEKIKEIFGLPDMATGYNHPRIADYALDMSGKGGWQVRLGVSEAFYPLNKGPARFVPGLHPKRLDKVTNATLGVDVRVLAFRPLPRDGIQCVSVRDFEQALEKAGWKKTPPLTSLNGETATSSFQHANKSVSINAECSKKIPETIFLWQKPTVPTN